MLAYLTATGLTNGVLIYAGIEANDEVITIGTTEQKIRILTVDLSASKARQMLVEKTTHQNLVNRAALKHFEMF